MGKLTLAKFEPERQAGLKSVNACCPFCLDDIKVICDAIHDPGGDPSYANCLNYLPDKLLQPELPGQTRQLKLQMSLRVEVMRGIALADCVDKFETFSKTYEYIKQYLNRC